MGALHLPELSSKSDYETFSDWVNTQVSDQSSVLNAHSITNSRFITNAEFIKHVKHLVGNEQLNENDPLDRDVVRYLYLTWTKYYSTSGMAGALSLERFNPLSYLNNPFALSGIFTVSNSRMLRSQAIRYSGKWKPDTQIFAFLTEPVISGISIHAP